MRAHDPAVGRCRRRQFCAPSLCLTSGVTRGGRTDGTGGHADGRLPRFNFLTIDCVSALAPATTVSVPPVEINQSDPTEPARESYKPKARAHSTWWRAVRMGGRQLESKRHTPPAAMHILLVAGDDHDRSVAVRGFGDRASATYTISRSALKWIANFGSEPEDSRPQFSGSVVLGEALQYSRTVCAQDQTATRGFTRQPAGVSCAEVLP
jgi:hypothetical protein